jgi:hypothetical protein
MEKIKRNDYETPYQHRVRSVQIIHERFGLMFTNKKFSVDFKTLQRKLPDLRKKCSTWNPRKNKECEQYLEAFSADNWKALSVEQKAGHSLMDCRDCFHRYSVYQSFFPVQSKKFQGCLKENPVIGGSEYRSQYESKSSQSQLHTTRVSRWRSKDLQRDQSCVSACF